MSSFYVEFLIKNMYNIKSSVMDGGNIEFLDDDVYLDILEIERTVKRLRKLNVITDDEFKVAKLISKGLSFRDIGNALKMSKTKVSSVFNDLCNKVSYVLGDYFTSDGFFDYMCEKYQLNEEDEETLSKLIFRRED